MDQVTSFDTRCWWRGLGSGVWRGRWGVSRNTVRRYLTMPEPRRIESRPRPRPVWAKVEQRIEELLESSPRWTGVKQRLTAARLHEMLVAEGRVVGETLVKAAVAEWKRRRRGVFVPLVYRPGELAEVDYFEVLVEIAGVRRKARLFVIRLMYSGRDFAWLYERQDQVSFLDGHVRALRRRAAADRVRQSEARRGADPGGIGARAHGTLPRASTPPLSRPRATEDRLIDVKGVGQLPNGGIRNHSIARKTSMQGSPRGPGCSSLHAGQLSE
jgi:hypothetical protein